MTLQVQQTFFRFCVIYVMYIFDRERATFLPQYRIADFELSRSKPYLYTLRIK